jgi:hypothetical protein
MHGIRFIFKDDG